MDELKVMTVDQNLVLSFCSAAQGMKSKANCFLDGGIEDPSDGSDDV